MPEELRLTPSTGRRRKRAHQTPQQKLDSSSPVVRLEGAFQIAYEALWGFPVILNPARDRTILKDMIEQLGSGDEAVGEKVVASLIPKFFSAVRPVQHGGDPVVSKSRYSNVMDFRYHAQHLMLLEKRGPLLADRTASNVDEVSKAMGRR